MSDLPMVPTLDHDPRNGEWITDPKGDDALAVRFYEYAPTGKTHIEIKFPGDERTVIDREPTEGDKLRFRRHWQAYQGDGDAFAGQTRIETVAWIDPGNAHEMRRWGIYTVEQLAGMSDSAIDHANMLGLPAFRQRAQEFLAERQRVSGYDELAAENAAMKARLDALEAASKPRGRNSQGGAR